MVGFVPLALDVARDAFVRVVGEGRVGVDGRDVPGLEWREYGLGEVAEVLWASGPDAVVADGVWSHVARRARGDRVWLVVGVGLALPALRRVAARICAGGGVDAADVNSEVVCGFIEALRGVEAGVSVGVFRRLRAAANAAGMRLVRADRVAVSVRGRVGCSVAPVFPVRHPDVVLARAVAASVISAGEAELIGATRLEGVPVGALAGRVGVGSGVVLTRRWRAERRLVAWILDDPGRSGDEAGLGVHG